jgi:ribosomal protein L3 glutamine methyltransferase
MHNNSKKGSIEIKQDIEQLNTLHDMVRYAMTSLIASKACFGHGYMDARQEAIAICCIALELNYRNFDDYTEFKDCKISLSEKTKIVDLLLQRITSKKPLAYLIKTAPFHGLDIYIDERVIVPRSFIGELLINDTLDVFIADAPKNILDVCTGSACLPILAANVFDDVHITGLDISLDALEVAKINVETYKDKYHDDVTNIKLIHSDVYSGLDQHADAGKYNIIISNPPYVNSNSMQKLPQEYQHEPNISLAGGLDGMDIVRKIIAGAKHFLAVDGILVVEIGNEYENTLAAFPELPFIWLSTSAGDEQVFLLRYNDLNI